MFWSSHVVYLSGDILCYWEVTCVHIITSISCLTYFLYVICWCYILYVDVLYVCVLLSSVESALFRSLPSTKVYLIKRLSMLWLELVSTSMVWNLWNSTQNWDPSFVENKVCVMTWPTWQACIRHELMWSGWMWCLPCMFLYVCMHACVRPLIFIPIMPLFARWKRCRCCLLQESRHHCRW